MRMDSPQTVHLSSLVQALYSSGSIWYPCPSGPSARSPLATPSHHSHLVGPFCCLALAFTQPPPALSSTLKRVTDHASVSSPHLDSLYPPLTKRLPKPPSVLHCNLTSVLDPHLCSL